MPPLGWVIDMRSERHAFMVTLYNRRFESREAAFAAEEVMYVTIERKEAFASLAGLLKVQEAETRRRLPPNTEFQYSGWKSDRDRQYHIRSIYIPGRQAIEITAFAEFPAFYAVCVLLTPLSNIKINFPRLIFVMDWLLGMEKQPEPGPAVDKSS